MVFSTGEGIFVEYFDQLFPVGMNPFGSTYGPFVISFQTNIRSLTCA